MAKYSFELKKKVVMAYINGEGGYNYLAKKHNISDESIVRRWVNAYKSFDDEGLLRSSKNKKYTFDFKLSVVKLYLTTKISYQELSLSVGMNNPPLITKWVNDYRIAGPDALRKKSKGRKPTMTKPKNNDKKDENTEYLKQLETENLKLRIENAYLKELRRLRLEKETLKKKRELSATSEDYSD